jgi:hypothetical protein
MYTKSQSFLGKIDFVYCVELFITEAKKGKDLNTKMIELKNILSVKKNKHIVKEPLGNSL